MLKIDTLESTLRNDCGQTSNKEAVCIIWFLHIEDSSNIQISGMLNQLMDARENI